MSSGFLIKVDLDGVCYDFESTMRWMLRRRIETRGDQVPFRLDVPSPHWDAVKDAVPPDDWDWLWSVGVEQGMFRYGHIINGAIEGMQALSQIGDVEILTHRPQAAVNDTLAWLSFMFHRVPLAGVILHSNGQPKSAAEPKGNVYIDDAPHVADDILDNTNSQFVMFHQPWNLTYNPGLRTLRGAKFIRAYGWVEVIRAVTRIKEAGL